jgi:hypothetical protein
VNYAVLIYGELGFILVKAVIQSARLYAAHSVWLSVTVDSIYRAILSMSRCVTYVIEREMMRGAVGRGAKRRAHLGPIGVVPSSEASTPVIHTVILLTEHSLFGFSQQHLSVILRMHLLLPRHLRPKHPLLLDLLPPRQQLIYVLRRVRVLSL